MNTVVNPAVAVSAPLVISSHQGDMTDKSKFFTVDNLVMSIPRGGITQVQALGVILGIVLDLPLRHAASTWNAGTGKYFLCAGYHDQAVVDERFVKGRLISKYDLDHANDVYSQGYAKHAGDQAQWLATRVDVLGITSIAMHAPAFHLPRVYLTVLEALRRKGIRIPILPVPTPMSPFERSLLKASTNERVFCQMDVINAEADPRMDSYMKEKSDGTPGDVATFEYFQEYLEWLYKQPIVKDACYTFQG